MELTHKEIFCLLDTAKKIMRESIQALTEIPDLLEWLDIVYPDPSPEFEERLRKFQNAR